MRRAFPHRLFLLAPLPLFALLVLLVMRCQQPESKAAHEWLNHHDTVKYVGIATCTSCHPDKADSFQHTGMGRSFGLATPERSAGNFRNHEPVYDRWLDLYYYPYWRNGKLMVDEFRLKGGDTVHKRTEVIRYIIGSGHHTNSHLIEDRGYLYQAPITYYVQQGKWDLPPGYENGNNIRFSRKIDMECMSCHNAMPGVEEGSVNKFTSIGEGIDCERCHGPGSLHVARKRAGELVDTRTMADKTIVNPAKLPWALQVDVCQRCHLQGNNVLKPGRSFADFRPGMRLSDVFEVYMPKTEGGDFFVMAGHAERLQKSACFIASNPPGSADKGSGMNLTCITCHNPHVSVKRTGETRFSDACRKCHGSGGNAAQKLCSAPEATRKAKGDRCTECHMPPSGTEDIPHVTVHDHWISKPGKGAAGEPTITGLYAVNNPKPDDASLARAYITWYEKFEAKGMYAEKAKALAEKADAGVRIHFAYTLRRFDDIVKEAAALDVKEVADAWTAYRIAVALRETGSKDQSLVWFGRAVERSPASLDFRAEYARALLLNLQFPEAEKELQAVLKEQPTHLRASETLAALFMSQRKPAEARRIYQQILQREPDHLPSLEAMQQLASAAGDMQSAALFQQRMAAVKKRTAPPVTE
jgi:hypothetical protein